MARFANNKSLVKRVITIALAVVMLTGVMAIAASATSTPAYTQSNYWFWDDPSGGLLIVPAPMGDDAIIAYDYDEDNLYIYTRMMEYKGVDGYFDSFVWGTDPATGQPAERMVSFDSTTGVGLVVIPLAELGNVTTPFFLYPVNVHITLTSGDHITLPNLYFWIQYGPTAP
jgi:hypothetical protein